MLRTKELDIVASVDNVISLLDNSSYKLVDFVFSYYWAGRFYIVDFQSLFSDLNVEHIFENDFLVALSINKKLSEINSPNGYVKYPLTGLTFKISQTEGFGGTIHIIYED